MQNQKYGRDRGVPIIYEGCSLGGAEAPVTLRADAQDLATLVIAAGRAGGVRGDGAAALRALVQLRRLPAMRSLAGAQAHLRSFAFGDSHGERE